MRIRIILLMSFIMLLLTGCNMIDDSSGLYAYNLPPDGRAYVLTDDGETFPAQKNYPDSIRDFCEKYKTARVAVYVSEKPVFISKSFSLLADDKFETASRIDFDYKYKTVDVTYKYSRKLLWFTVYGWLGIGIILIIICNTVLNMILSVYGDFRMKTGRAQRVIFLALSLPNVLTTLLAGYIMYANRSYGGDVLLMLILVILINIFYASLACEFCFKEPQELRQKPEYLQKPKQMK